MGVPVLLTKLPVILSRSLVPGVAMEAPAVPSSKVQLLLKFQVVSLPMLSVPMLLPGAAMPLIVVGFAPCQNWVVQK